MRFDRKVVLWFFLLALPATAQMTIHVPADQSSIQAGINASHDGDTVLVSPGIYKELIDFQGKAVTVTSSDGPADTVIDAQHSGVPVKFIHNETRSSILNGFTITGGMGSSTTGLGHVAPDEGGIYIESSSPTITNNIITANLCYGISVDSAWPLIQKNEINNTQISSFQCGSGGAGSGIFVANVNTLETPFILDNVIENNKQGGLQPNLHSGGAGITVWSASFVIIGRNIIRNNAVGLTDTGSGGGPGGGVYILSSSGVLFDNLVYANSANLPGGGVALALSEGISPGIMLLNNTIADNSVIPLPSRPVTSGGEQLEMDIAYSGVTFYNNIVSGSTADSSILCYNTSNPFHNPPSTFDSNDFYNASGPSNSNPTADPACDFTPGTTNNLSLDPQFAQPSAGDYTLKSSSPLIDVGNNTGLTPETVTYHFTIPTDLAGNVRVQNETGKSTAIVDIGAYELGGAVAGTPVTETLISSENPSYVGDMVAFTASLSSTSGIPTGSVQFFSDGTQLSAQTVNASGMASINTSSLSEGTHTITAAYRPTGVYASANASLTQVVTTYKTTSALTCTPSPTFIDRTIILDFTVSSQSGTPTGTVSITADGTSIGQNQLVNGSSTFSYTGTVAGDHVFIATYAPTGAFASSTSACTVLFNKLPTTSSLTATPNNALLNSSINLIATVSPTMLPGVGTPTGNVTFLDGYTAVGVGTILSNGTATVATNKLLVGTHPLACTYSGDDTYATSNCPAISVTINPIQATLTLTSSTNPSLALTPVTFTAHLDTGSEPKAGNTISLIIAGRYFVGTTDANGDISFVVNNLNRGSYPVTAYFAATTNLLASNATLTQVVNFNAASIILTASPNPAYETQLVTITATLTALDGVIPTGVVTLYDNGTPMGTAIANVSGVVTFTTSTLAVGTHLLSATFPSGPAFTGATSNTVQEVIQPSGFTIALSPTTLQLGPGASGSSAILLTSVGIFAGPLNLTYGALPQYATAWISPQTVTLTAGGAATSQLAMNTLSTASLLEPHIGKNGAVLSLAFFVFLPFVRRRRFSRLLLLLFAAGTLQLMTGCTNNWYKAHSVAPGAYQVLVTATDSNHISHSATLTVEMTQ